MTNAIRCCTKRNRNTTTVHSNGLFPLFLVIYIIAYYRDYNYCAFLCTQRWYSLRATRMYTREHAHCTHYTLHKHSKVCCRLARCECEAITKYKHVGAQSDAVRNNTATETCSGAVRSAAPCHFGANARARNERNRTPAVGQPSSQPASHTTHDIVHALRPSIIRISNGNRARPNTRRQNRQPRARSSAAAADPTRQSY